MSFFRIVRKNHGDEEMRELVTLFYALWIPDLVYETYSTIMETGRLCCPDQCRGLCPMYTATNLKNYIVNFTNLRKDMRSIKTVLTLEIYGLKFWIAQMETGTPYLCYIKMLVIKNLTKKT